ncbi:glycosyltransferase 61 family protein [Nocardioides sp. C4-1]|uniref:glycosyltransferase 61 family protein n=1 Tax=Nocardioides sp. C4-1 TaxID=3151851 RepID=UPI0032642933
MSGTTDGARGAWAVPTFPYEPVGGPPELVTVDGALLTEVRRGRLRTVAEPTEWIRGAVHDGDGRLVESSQKIGGLGGAQVAPADPERVPARRLRRTARRLEGTWLYGGHWTQHFGHFFLETLTTLWPTLGAGDVAGIVFHNWGHRFRGVSPWQRELLGLAGRGESPFVVVHDDPHQVDTLLVPGRGLVVNGWAWPQARSVWELMATNAAEPDAVRAPGSGGRVFLSRTSFNDRRRAEGRPTRTDAGRDRALDDAFADAGFAVVAPEQLPLREQLRLAAGAALLAGSAGSALHLSAFAPPSARVLELGDPRSPDVQVPSQRVIDRACGHRSAFVPYDVAAPDLGERLAVLLAGC